METVPVNQREIWLCPFPFSDLSGEKVRPVLILSNEHYNSISNDVVVCALTSNISSKPYTIIVQQIDCEKGVLFDRSSIRVDTLFKLNKNLLKKTICTLKPEVFRAITKILFSIVE